MEGSPEAKAAGWLPEEWEAYMGALGEPAYRGRQAFEAIHTQGLRSLADLTVWPKALRERLAPVMPIPYPVTVKDFHDEDGTRRWLLRGESPAPFEMVHIPLQGRNTLCLSSQSGCAVGCVFCATGTLGFKRHLEAFELCAQVYLAEAAVGRLDHLVLMGMGEPLLNLNEVLRFLRLITHPKGRRLSPSRITLSTVGFKPGLEELLRFELPVHLALSLHAATDDLRKELVPRAGTDVATLLALGEAYARKTGEPVTLEWVLMHGRNDTAEQARTLAGLLKQRPFKVNLIPVNPVEGLPATAGSSEKDTQAFMEILRKAGVDVFRRDTRGGGINAACGQLAARE